MWEEHQPAQLVGEFFPQPEEFTELRFVDALRRTGGEEDARRKLLREAVAGILNGAHESLGYPFSRYEPGLDGRPPLVPTVAELLRTGTIEQVEAFRQELAAANRLGCPLR